MSRQNRGISGFLSNAIRVNNTSATRPPRGTGLAVGNAVGKTRGRIQGAALSNRLSGRSRQPGATTSGRWSFHDTITSLNKNDRRQFVLRAMFGGTRKAVDWLQQKTKRDAILRGRTYKGSGDLSVLPQRKKSPCSDGCTPQEAVEIAKEPEQAAPTPEPVIAEPVKTYENDLGVSPEKDAVKTFGDYGPALNDPLGIGGLILSSVGTNKLPVSPAKRKTNTLGLNVFGDLGLGLGGII